MPGWRCVEHANSLWTFDKLASPCDTGEMQGHVGEEYHLRNIGVLDEEIARQITLISVFV